MIRIRPAAERGHYDHGWLDTRHTFSFGEYRDPRHMGFRSLRVINEDRVRPGEGFGTHGHRDMEILTWVLAGELAHKDSLGNASVVRPGELQRMTAGTGVLHSEFNPSTEEPVHFLQIWILPETESLEPSYEQRAFAADERRNRWQSIASRDGRRGTMVVHQDVVVHAADLEAGAELVHRLGPDRHAWLQVARGTVELAGHRLEAGSGAAASGEPALLLVAEDAAEVLLFDLG
jgi:hypothetical protein